MKKVLCFLGIKFSGWLCYLAYSFVLGELLVVYNTLCNLRTKQKIRATHSYSFWKHQKYSEHGTLKRPEIKAGKLQEWFSDYFFKCSLKANKMILNTKKVQYIFLKNEWNPHK